MQGKLGDKTRLMHVLEAVSKINQYIEGKSVDSFVNNSMVLDACVRQLQIIGEACNKVSKDLQEEYHEIPWRQIIDLRIVVVHQYFGVDEKVIWDILQHDLSSLKDQIEKIISELE
jgi:uncharacterized protein with HEPN domain